MEPTHNPREGERIHSSFFICDSFFKPIPDPQDPTQVILLEAAPEKMMPFSNSPSSSTPTEPVKPGSIDHTLVRGLAGFKQIGATFLELKNIMKPTSYTKSVLRDFERLYHEVLVKETTHEYVNVSWATELQAVVTRLRDFEQENADTHWVILKLNFWSLQKEAKKFEHQHKILKIKRCFYPMA